MARVPKVIENPEVPGLEILPIPPPPPPPIISKHAEQEKRNSNSTVKNDVIIKKLPDKKSTCEKNDVIGSGQTSANPFSAQPVEQVPSNDQPWWIPTDADTAEMGAKNTPWMDKNTVWTDPNATNIPTGGKAKAKFNKRKAECIDPAQDAERVASAQKELSALMKPLQCDLCNAVMNSTLQAKLHYDGKPHQKKVSMFLNQSVKKVKIEDGPVSEAPSNDWNTYCDVCKTWFTSLIDASQHYAGKKHIRATTGIAKQKAKKSQVPTTDPTGRFGIGMAFTPGNPTAAAAPTESFDPTIQPAAPTAVSPVNNCPTLNWPFPTFRCELCGVTANRQEQLETHKRGAKHLRMLKFCEEVKEYSVQPAPSSIDYSIYRTPSGQYYCAPCNRSFHSENSFAHHIESKKHKTQINPKQQQTQPAALKKFYVEKNN